MNIQSIVSMGFMMRSVQASVRRGSSKETAQPTAFEQRLYEFREKNTLDKLREPEKQEIGADKREEEDWRKVSCSSQLFSVWDGSLSAEEALKRLDSNLSRIGEYSFDSALGPREVLEHIAAQYSIHKRHVSGDEEQSKALDKMIEQYTKQYATELADSVGTFYESNGMVGERDRIHESALDSVKALTNLYDQYIVDNKKQYYELEMDTHQNRQSLSNELRKAVRESGVGSEGVVKIGNQNSVGLERAAKLAKISASVEKRLSTAKITNEEELGILLGKNIVLALSHVYDFDKPMSAHEEAFLQSIEKHNNQYMDKVDGMLSSKVEKYSFKLSDTKENPNLLDREAVFAVINVMTKEYRKTRSMASALDKGKAFGLKQYLDKADVDSKSERYQSSTFWEQMVKDVLKPSNKAAKQYRWIQDLLDNKSNSWLNLIA